MENQDQTIIIGLLALIVGLIVGYFFGGSTMPHYSFLSNDSMYEEMEEHMYGDEIIDGDGAMIMHMGALTTSANSNNLLHIVFNNGAHESVGGQATMGLELSLKEIAAKCGYREIYEANSEESIKKVLADAVKKNVSIFIEITCSNSSRPDLGRPEKSARKNRDDFMNFVNKRI